MCHGRCEPAELHGLTEQVTEAKDAPLELRRKREAKNMCLGDRGGKGQACSIERGALHPPSILRALRMGILGEFPQEDLNRVRISFPGVSFQGCDFH